VNQTTSQLDHNPRARNPVGITLSYFLFDYRADQCLQIT